MMRERRRHDPTTPRRVTCEETKKNAEANLGTRAWKHAIFVDRSALRDGEGHYAPAQTIGLGITRPSAAPMTKK